MKPDYSANTRILKDFKHISKKDYVNIVRFYRATKPYLSQMNFEESFAISTAYLNALFHLKEYQEVILQADKIIETSILENIQYQDGEDIYLRTLYQKAISLYYIDDVAGAEKILLTLLNMRPYNPIYRQAIRRIFRYQNLKGARNGVALGMFLYLVSILIMLFGMLVIKPHYPVYEQIATEIRWVNLLVAVLVMLGTWLWYPIQADRRLRKELKNIFSKISH